MNTLYRFWSYYLRETNDAKMYSDFKTFASEDARRSYMCAPAFCFPTHCVNFRVVSPRR